MGGRKSSSIGIITGNKPNLNYLKGKLVKSLKDEDIERATYVSFKLLASSEPAMLTLIYSLEFLNFFDKYSKERDEPREILLAKIAHDWIQYKTEENLSTSKEIDRIYISTFINYLKSPDKDLKNTQIRFFADILYKELISIIRSKNTGLHFYRLGIPQQKKIEYKYKEFAITYSKIFFKDHYSEQSTINVNWKIATNLLHDLMGGGYG